MKERLAYSMNIQLFAVDEFDADDERAATRLQTICEDYDLENDPDFELSNRIASLANSTFSAASLKCGADHLKSIDHSLKEISNSLKLIAGKV